MESRYEVLRSLKDEGLFTKLVSSGIISIDVATRTSIYEEYLSHFEGYNKSEAVRLTANSMKISASNLYVIIRYMQ